MKKSVRKILFWVFFAAFLIISPSVILYSQGYRFDWYKNIFIHSGSITVKSLPSTVDIYINGEKAEGNSLDIINRSITIGGLRPGNYDLRVRADGYREWQKNIEVHSGISTEFWNVLLVPNSIAPEKIDAGDAKKIFLSPSKKKIAYLAETGEAKEIRYYDLENEKNILLHKNSELFLSDRKFSSVDWNTRENMILCPVMNEEKKDVVIVDLGGKNSEFFASQKFEVENIEKARWSLSNEYEFYFLSKPEGKDSYSLYLANVYYESLKLVSDDVAAYDISANHLYLLKDNDTLHQTDLGGKGAVQIAAENLSVEKKMGSRLIAYDRERQIILDGSGNLLIHNKGKEDIVKKFEGNVQDAQFSNDGKKLLFWRDYDINVMFLRDWDDQPRRKENEIQQLIRFSSPISNVSWCRDYEHVFFANSKSMKLISIDSRDHRISSDIFQFTTDDFFSTYDPANRILYYLDGENIDRGIFFFEFPKGEGIFN